MEDIINRQDVKMEVDETNLGSCPPVSLDINCVNASGSTTEEYR
jgi:hypothetical protein